MKYAPVDTRAGHDRGAGGDDLIARVRTRMARERAQAAAQAQMGHPLFSERWMSYNPYGALYKSAVARKLITAKRTRLWASNLAHMEVQMTAGRAAGLRLSAAAT